MITCKPSDYLTISAMPGDVDISRHDFVYQVFNALYISDWFDSDSDIFVFKCSSQYYEFIYRFGDISLKIAYEHNFKKQGICFEFSGKGIDYYNEYLNTKFVGVSLRSACARFVALSKFGYKTTCSRFDVAFDEIIKKGEEDQQLLDLDTIQGCLLGGEFVCRFRKCDPSQISGVASSVPVALGSVSSEIINSDPELPYRIIQSMHLSSGRIGKTIELGKRKSNTFVRFYDKLSEQLAHNYSIDSSIESWNRFEIEFKKTNASAVFLAYATSPDDKHFSEYMRSVALHLLRFVSLTASRKYNCKTAEWWDKFLNRVKSAKLEIHKPKYNKFVRSLEAQKRQNAASLAALVCCRPQTLVELIKLGLHKPSKTSEAIASDYKSIRNLSPDEYDSLYQDNITPLTGLDFWKQFCGFSSVSDSAFDKFVDDTVSSFCNNALSEVGL